MTDRRLQPTRVAVVGVGNVGATFAYALLLSGLAAEIVLIDVNRARAEGEAMDLNHAVPFAHPTRIWPGDFADGAGAAVTVIAAGTNQKPGESRLDLLKRNAAIFRQVVPEVARRNPDGILLIATNPVDVLTYVSLKLSGLPPRRVIGSGTTLDTARFRYVLSQHFGVDARSVHAHVIGEHGDSEVPVWSLANIAGMRLPDYCAANGMTYDQAVMDGIFTADARCCLPDHRAQGGHLLCRRGRLDAHRRGDPARPEHGPVGLQSGRGLSGPERRVLEPAHRRESRWGGAGAAVEAQFPGDRGSAPIGRRPASNRRPVGAGGTVRRSRS